VHGVHRHFPYLNLRPPEIQLLKQKTSTLPPKDPPAGAAKYGGPHPHRHGHGHRLDDSLSFLNIILFSSIII
jgi:hypothetical protein